jgi:hypothetical protein
MYFHHTQSFDLTTENNFSRASHIPRKRTTSCEEARFASAEGCGIAHETYASILKRQRDPESSAESSCPSMPLWRKRQERILLALTPQQYCINETQQETGQGCQNIVSLSSSELRDDRKVTEDSLYLNVDHPRMRYAEVPSLVALFNLNAQYTRTNNDQPKVDNRYNDKLATLLTCMKVSGDS